MPLLKTPLESCINNYNAIFLKGRDEQLNETSFKVKVIKQYEKDGIRFLSKQCKENSSQMNSKELTKWLKVSNREIQNFYKPEMAELKEIIDKKGLKIFIDCTAGLGLSKTLAENNETLAIFEPESFFLMSLSRAKTSDQLVKLLVRAYSGEDFSYTTAYEDIYLANPKLNICLAIQPKNAMDFLLNENFNSLGLTARFMPIFVNHNSYMKNDPSRIDLTYQEYIDFNELIQNILNNTVLLLTNQTINFGDKAKELANNALHYIRPVLLLRTQTFIIRNVLI
jgi:hypothetical protein